MSAECSACDIPPRYKQTEAGVIPNDWSSICYADYLNIVSGLGFKKAEYCDVGIRLLRIDNVSYGQISWDSIAYLPLQYIEKFPNLVLSEGDILLALNRPITNNQLKLARLGAEDSPAILYQRVGKIEVTNSKLDKRFAYFVLRKFIRKFVEESSVGSDQPFVSTTALKKIHIPLPPTLAEQESIAEALSDTDALIESLEQLIAKKRQIKQGAMQELLTGKRRLPGFSGEWETKPLGEVIDSCSSGATPYRGRPEYYKGKVKWITSGELNYNLIADTLEHISDEAVEHTNLKIHPAGTFLMAITGLEAAGTRGACGIVGSPATTNQSCMAIYPTSELKTEYLYHYYVFRGNELALQYCQGTKQQSYTAKLVKLLPIDLPPTVEEQIAISDVLSDMDSEITALEEKLAKARQIKQGMMQELLTGRIRLI
jgi:type I restriction enzyme S subunit